MRKLQWLAAGATAFGGLAACAPVAVSGFNGHSVEVQSGSMAIEEEVVAQATRICGTVGRRAEYASSRELYAPQYLAAYAHLFLCLDA